MLLVLVSVVLVSVVLMIFRMVGVITTIFVTVARFLFLALYSILAFFHAIHFLLSFFTPTTGTRGRTIEIRIRFTHFREDRKSLKQINLFFGIEVLS